MPMCPDAAIVGSIGSHAVLVMQGMPERASVFYRRRTGLVLGTDRPEGLITCTTKLLKSVARCCWASEGVGFVSY